MVLLCAGIFQREGIHSHTRFVRILEREWSCDDHVMYSAGPVEKTAADFWSVVWSEKCQNIVMIANLMEDYKVCIPTLCIAEDVFICLCWSAQMLPVLAQWRCVSGSLVLYLPAR